MKLGALCWGMTAWTALAWAAPGDVALRIDEGLNINALLREGPVAAHLLLRAGTEPRILVAFPAGNSGVGLWFESTAAQLTWTLLVAPQPVIVSDAQHRPLRGIEFEVGTDVEELRPRAALLSSVRVLRDYELQRQAPAEVMVAPATDPAHIAWSRDRLDGAAGYRLAIEARDGTRLSAARFIAAPGKPLRLRIQALTGETPLTPQDSVLAAQAGDDARARAVLDFLSYREKFLAGSWRFDTYFGRDTLMSALLLAPVLEPAAIESAIASTLERLAPNGEVAHEEDIGEFAVLRNAREGRGRVATPIYDYGMVDDDFMLAPLAARWLLDDSRGRARAREFLAGKNAAGERRGTALARNLTWLVERVEPFVRAPRAANLVSIKAGRMTGNWRDSETGLGHGRYPYDVNASLVPAALDAAARLAQARLLDDYLDSRQRRTLAGARAAERVWKAEAPPMFATRIPLAQAREQIADYATAIGVDADRALPSLRDDPIEFHALSLDAQGRPVPILNSDEGFRFLLTDPSPQEIATCLAIIRPYPAGLLTEAGLLVANPAFADAQLRREFTRFAYHGTVIWSWQQALLAAGIERQLRRADLPAPLRTQLMQARSALWAVIEKTRSLRSSELWSWSYSGGQYRMEPFGRPGADVDESNAAQLWSTVFLGLEPAATKGSAPGN